MEKTLKSANNDKEFMRMAMLKHEETFREQVNELHRLYRIQKMLMESVGLNQQQQQQQQQKQELESSRYNMVVESNKKAFTIDHYQQQLLLQAQQAQAQAQAQAQRQRDIISSTIINDDKSKIITSNTNNVMGLNLMGPDNQVVRGPRSSDAQEHIAESNGNGNNKLMRLDENEIELTLSLGPATCNPRRRKTGNSESGQSISSSSTGSSQTKKTSPSKNNNNNNNNDNRSSLTWGSFPQGSGIEPGFSNAQQSSNPPWLYQALSLKLT